MMRLQRGPILLVLLLFAGTAWAETEPEATPEPEIERVWSATVVGDFKFITDRHADNDVGAFFDQWEFTPNKSRALPIELGLRKFSYDRFEPLQTPRVQIRFASPTSNLGISGSEADEPFLNQRALLHERYSSIEIDLEYWRFRTEDLRLFPNTQGRQFEDLTSVTDRFDRERTGVSTEIRLRPQDAIGEPTDAVKWLAPEFSARASFEDRDGSDQLLFIQERSNRWGALSQSRDQERTTGGGGLLVAPGGWFTMAMDVDYKRFRHDAATTTQRDLESGFLADDNSVGFIADTDRLTGTVMLQSRIGDRAVVEGGFHVSRLEQVDDFTPLQLAAGLDDNRLLFYSMNAAADVNATDQLSFNAFIKYDRRKNKIQRDTFVFNPLDDGVQSSPFLKRWDRVYTGAEAVYALHQRNLVALGARYEWIDRDLDFGLPTNLTILEPNIRIAEQTRMWTVYGRTNLRPMRGLGISGEVGYRGAPDTGYITDLDKYVYGKLRASYRLPIDDTVLISTFVRGGSGENRDFSLTSGTGTTPSGDKAPVDFDRKHLTWGVTLTTYPLDELSVFASFFQTFDEQNYDLVLSSLQRYLQTATPVDFYSDGSPDHENKQMSVVVGAHVQFTDSTDGGITYSFTRAELDYDSAGETANVKRIADARSIDSDIHAIQLEVGHWLRSGMRLHAGYRLQQFDDANSRPLHAGSVVRSIDPSTTQHTVSIGVTLTSEITAAPE